MKLIKDLKKAIEGAVVVGGTWAGWAIFRSYHLTSMEFKQAAFAMMTGIPVAGTATLCIATPCAVIYTIWAKNQAASSMNRLTINDDSNGNNPSTEDNYIGLQQG